MSKTIWSSLKLVSCARMYMLYKILCPVDSLVQPSQKYGPLVTRITYSKTEPSDNRPPPKLPLLPFFTHSLFPNLRELSLAGSALWMDAQFLQTVGSNIGANLPSLSLSGITRRITEDQFSKILMKFTSLTSLSLENVCINDSTLASLSLPHLDSLRLVCCNKITPESLHSLFQTHKNITLLNIESCEGINESIFPLPLSIRQLALSNQSGIPPAQLVQGLACLRPHQISSLDLSNMSQLTDESLDAILKGQRGIRQLVLAGCSGCDAYSIQRSAGKWCKELRFLDRRYCKGRLAFGGLKGVRVLSDEDGHMCS